MTGRRIAIVGAGFSGASVAAQLLRAPGRNEIALIERAKRFGPGLAYSANDKASLLNVRAANMSALQDEPADFVRWLAPSTQEGVGDIFAPREKYGRYIENVLNGAERGGFAKLKRISASAIACRPEGDGWSIELDHSRPVTADAIVLALGNVQSHLTGPLSDVPVSDAWDAHARRRIPRRADVLLVGSGLTAIDVTLALEAQHHQGVIYALSRRGLVPRAQTVASRAPPLNLVDFPAPLSDALHTFRREVRAMAERGEPWQWAMERIRTATPDLWARLTLAQQRRFLRHLRPWWDTHRHRAAPEVGVHVDDLVKQGRLRILAGEIVAVTPTTRGLQVMHRQRGSFVRHRLEVGAVINCTGAVFDVTTSGDPLVMQLRNDGHIRSHPTGLGFDVDRSGGLIGANGQKTAGLFTLGPPTQGAFWESTAVPEIRRRAEQLAQMLADQG